MLGSFWCGWGIDPCPLTPYNTHSNQPHLMTTLTIDGVQFKVTRLPVAHGVASNRWTDRIRGGSTRVRTHGGAAGSAATCMSTANSALADVR